jgi:hypothetical protein
MSRSAQTLLPPRPSADLRSPAEQALLLAAWAGAIVLCLAFWAAVALVWVW